MTSTALDIVLGYVARGWSPVPVPFREKGPKLSGWQNLRITADDAPRYFNGKAMNVGVILGPASKGLADVDLDCSEAVEVASYLLPKTRAIFGRESRRSSHWLYTAPGLAEARGVKSIEFFDPLLPEGENMIVELRIGGAGAQTIFPGSTHESGEEIGWEASGDPAEIDGDELQRCVGYVAAAAILARHWPRDGSHLRHKAAMAIGGFLAHGGWSTYKAKTFLEAVAKAAGDREWKDRIKAAEDSVENHKKGKQVQGLPTLKELIDERVAIKAGEWLGLVETDAFGHTRRTAGGEAKEESAAETASEPIFDPWEEWIVPKFPFEILPPVVQRYVTEQSRVIGCDPSTMAMTVLANFSGALDHQHRLRMMRNGDWYVTPRLWVLLVGPPSYKKTPAIKAALAELKEHEHRSVAAYRQRYAEYEEALAGWDKKSGTAAPVEPKKPVRFVASDTTIEKLGELLTRSARGILIHRDEWAGWIGQMEKYGGKSGSDADRSFWLQSFDGGPYTVDRIGRGETYIPNLSVSLIGGVQPEKLKGLHGLTSDGLLQRFLPVMMGAASLPQDAPASQSEKDYRDLTRRLINLPPGGLSFSDDALPVMNELRQYIHDLEQVAGGLANGFEGFLGKLAGYSGSLALILHLAHDPEEARMRQVSRKTAENVKRLVEDFILPHALEFYRTAETVTDGDRVQQVASWIITSKKSRVTSRDLVRNVRILRGASVKDLHLCLSPLVAGGWLIPEKPGPDNNAWTVTPVVQQQFEERRRLEEARKAAVARLMNSPRKGSPT